MTDQSTQGFETIVPWRVQNAGFDDFDNYHSGDEYDIDNDNQVMKSETSADELIQDHDSSVNDSERQLPYDGMCFGHSLTHLSLE